jgi:TetR/AcrR family transcriptional repressor of nem operon
MPRATDSRLRLIRSAKDLFYAHGYNAVGVKEICERAAVNKGSFYHFFPSKRDLLIAVIEAHAEWLGAVMQEAARPDLPALERVRRLFTLVGRFDGDVRRRLGHVVGCPFGNLAAELSSQDEIVRRKIDDVFNHGIAFIETQLEEAIAAGQIEAVDTTVAAEAILAYLEGTHLLAATRDSPDLVAELSDGALRLAGVRRIAEEVEPENPPDGNESQAGRA